MNNPVKINDISVGYGAPLALISGPCVIEDYETTFEIALFLKELTQRLDIPFVFKASYDKANRTSVHSFRGPGLRNGLDILARIKSKLGISILSDVHRISEAEAAAEVLDVIQIPAFLCRQTDFILGVAKTGKPVNIKKGQFLAPWDMKNVAEKLASAGNRQLLLTDRGTMFGYNNLVADFRGIRIMQETGYPVIFDATHSVQLPGGAGTSSGGQREFAPILARAAVAAGADGIFLEVHKDPDKALCDGPNSLRLDTLYELFSQLKAIRRAVRTAVFPANGLRDRLKQIKLLLLDVDGVLTDGSIIYDDNGAQTKNFNVRDGLGIRLLMKVGIGVGIITGRVSDALRHRCKNLGIDLVFDGIIDKAPLLEKIMKQTGLLPENIAFIGDDLLDTPLMKRIGVPVAVADAHESVLEAALMVTEARGGAGAVREVCEAILKAQGLWEKILDGIGTEK